ncbi:hypothetical protein [Natronococcus jeotgali]|nr:hypothetical protein [Natronococcus jeotgali]
MLSRRTLAVLDFLGNATAVLVQLFLPERVGPSRTAATGGLARGPRRRE